MKHLLLRFVLGVLVLSGLGHAQAQMAQVPLFQGAASVPPNLVFTFDDSGSMVFECLPEDLCVGSKYVGSMPWGTGTFKSGAATYLPSNSTQALFVRRLRSPAINSQYYNPGITYSPWIKSDGTRYTAYAATAAPVDPRVTATVVNLVATQTVTGVFCTDDSTCATSSQSLYPAQYWRLISGTGTATANFTVTFISGSSTTTFAKDPDRTDCASASVCTLAEEQQNFSNWFTYYRSKLLAAIGGTAAAFFNLPVSYRLGYGRINQDTGISIDGTSTNTLVRGLRSFTGTDRDAFYTWLFTLQPDPGGTPLRRAMGDVGEYYKRSDNRGPWGNVPGTNDSTAHLTCRRAFHLLMTDGSWNGDGASNSGATGNVDNTNVTTPIVGPNSQSYTYTRAYPYRDANSDTLADVAMYYWRTDLRTDLANDVVATTSDPAFWQHMVNYTIGFGVNGNLVNPDDLPALTSNTKSWGSPATDANNKVDDLWHAAINSRGLSLNAADQVAYANALRAVITSIDERNGSDAGVAVSGRYLTASTRRYTPGYRTNVWTGELTAASLDSSGNLGPVAWTASDHLPAAANRVIYTYKDSTTKSVTFTWAGLTAAGMTSTLNVSTTAEGTSLVPYLRGDATGEGSTYRTRAKKLGDIVNSGPALVKDGLDLSYEFLPSSVGAVGTRTAAGTYREFVRNKSYRVGQVYVGANDGMLHVFSDVNGTETFAFIPKAVLGSLKYLSVAPYDHRFYVDGPVVEADIYDTTLGTAGGWRNIVVGGGGGGAKNLFAINAPVAVTPTSGSLTVTLMSPGPSDILWEVSNTSSTTFAELGYVLQTPEVGVMRDGSWAVIVGNGYESASGRAQLFIINALTGALIKKLDTGIPVSGGGNGLGSVRLMRDSSRQVVSAYAGDLLGNLWKFDLSSTVPANWTVAFSSTPAAPKPLFTAVNRNGQAEPITSAPALTRHPGGGVMVVTGGGKLFEAADPNNTQERTLYGVWDKVPVGATSATASLVISGTSTLVLQQFTTVTTVTTSGSGTATVTALSVTDNAVDYATKRGWRLPMTTVAGQRLIYDPQLVGSGVFVETVVPGAAVLSCTASSGISYNYVLDPFTGGSLGIPVFDSNLDGVIDGKDDAKVTGYQGGIGGASAIIYVGGGTTSSGSTAVGTSLAAGSGYFLNVAGSKAFNVGGSSTVRRSWRQIISPPPVL